MNSGDDREELFSGLTRSQLMSRIRSSGNKKTEIALVRFFKVNHITGWRRHQPLHGKPDFVFPKLKLAVFVDGCFWHGCPLHFRMPATRRAFWRKKIDNNRMRDHRVTRELQRSGWRVLRIWEHELSKKNEPRLLRRVRKAISPGTSE